MKKPRAMVLIIVLITTVIVLMMSGALLTLGRMDLGNATHYHGRQRALEMARGGLNHAVRALTLNPASSADISYQSGDSSYNVTFVATSAERSVNNLALDAQSATTNFQGKPVYARSADLLVVGRAGQSRVRVRALLGRGVNFTRSVGAVGSVFLDGDCYLDGIKSMVQPDKVGGGIYSQKGGADAVRWGGSGGFDMEGETRIGTPASDGVSSNIRSLYPGRIQAGSSETVPTLDIASMVNSKSSAPEPTYTSTSGGTRFLGPTSINADHYVPGDLVINGDLVLGDASLYVNGKLTINGGIIGTGSVMADGDLAIRGGNTVLMSNQSSGAAVYASGDVTMEGINAEGYLDQLAAAHPNIGNQATRVRTQLDMMHDAAVSPPTPANQDVLWGATRELNRSDSIMGTKDDYFLCPIPGPTGQHALGGSNSPVPALTLAIKNDLGASYASDVKAQRIVKGLEQTFYNFRFSFFNGPADAAIGPDYRIPGVSPAQFYASKIQGNWDDDPLMLVLPTQAWDAWTGAVRAANPGVFKNLTTDHQYRAVGTTAGVNDDLRKTMFDQVKSFLDHNHPLDANWLGKSYFQGVVYAGGRLNVSNQFSVMGGLLSRSDVSLTGGSSLVYDEEMMRFSGSLGPLQLQVYEEY